MSYLFDNANDNLIGTLASSYPSYPMTLAVYVKYSAHPAAVDTLFTIAGSVGSNANSHKISTDTAAGQWTGQTFSSAGTAQNCVVSGSADAIDGIWAAMVYVCTDETTRQFYINSLAVTSINNTSVVVFNGPNVRMGENMLGAQDLGARLAEAALWKTALTGTEVGDYISGVKATTIQPSNLIGYWPLDTNGVLTNDGTDSGGDLAATGAVFDADHPTITIPGASSRRRRAALMGLG